MAEPKVYCAYINANINPGMGISKIFRIVSPNRKMKLKSIFIHWQVTDNTTGLNVPLEQMTGQRMNLSIGSSVVPAQKIAADFTENPGNPFTSRGYSYYICSPGQLKFDSFHMINEIGFLLTINNLTGGTSYNNLWSIVCEVEEKNIYI